jgi:hypothetical protein
MAPAKKNRKAPKSLKKAKKMKKVESPLVFRFGLVAVKT